MNIYNRIEKYAVEKINVNIKLMFTLNIEKKLEFTVIYKNKDRKNIILGRGDTVAASLNHAGQNISAMIYYGISSEQFTGI